MRPRRFRLVREQRRHRMSARVRNISFSGKLRLDISNRRHRSRRPFRLLYMIPLRPIPRNIAPLAFVPAFTARWRVGKGALNKRWRRSKWLPAGGSSRLWWSQSFALLARLSGWGPRSVGAAAAPQLRRGWLPMMEIQAWARLLLCRLRAQMSLWTVRRSSRLATMGQTSTCTTTAAAASAASAANDNKTITSCSANDAAHGLSSWSGR